MTRVGEVGAYCSLLCALRDGARQEAACSIAIRFLKAAEFRFCVRHAVRRVVRRMAKKGAGV